MEKKMNKAKCRITSLIVLWLGYILSSDVLAFSSFPGETPMTRLPPPKEGNIALETALRQRRAVRSYSEEAVSMEAISQLLWAGQGVTSADGRRTAPSAGALYPLELYLVAGNVSGLSPGVYRYDPHIHGLKSIQDKDIRRQLSLAALGQSCIASASVSIVITAVYARTAGKYRSRANRYVHMEAGHAAQNILLQAVTLELGTLVIGAFEEDKIRDVLSLPIEHAPLYIIPIGHPASERH